MSALVDLWLGLLKSWTRTTSFIGKEVIEVVRRPGALFSLIFGPFLIMGLFGLGYSGQYRPLNTVLVVPANSDLPRDKEFYQQYMGDSVNIVDITDDADAATRPAAAPGDRPRGDRARPTSSRTSRAASSRRSASSTTSSTRCATTTRASSPIARSRN